LDGHA